MFAFNFNITNMSNTAAVVASSGGSVRRVSPFANAFASLFSRDERNEIELHDGNGTDGRMSAYCKKWEKLDWLCMESREAL